jgi:hypothetical protein
MMTVKKIPNLSIVNFLICGGGILIFAAIALYPNQRILDKADAELRKITAHIEAQKALYPLFEELLKLNQTKEVIGLPFPEKSAIAQNDIGAVTSRIKDIARQNRLEPEEVAPDVNTLIDDSGRLRMFVKLRGNFFRLQPFMVDIGGIPYVEHIEQIQIRTLQQSDDLDMSLKIWMARE